MPMHGNPPRGRPSRRRNHWPNSWCYWARWDQSSNKKLDPDQGTALKAAVVALQEHLRVQEPKAAKQARLQSVMAQGQAKRAKFKFLKESTRTMRLELEAAEQKLEDLEEEIQRLDQEEKILCAEVQEAEDPQGEDGDSGMRNVHRRIRIFYGEPWGLSVQSAPDRGTRVEIRVPVACAVRPRATEAP